MVYGLGEREADSLSPSYSELLLGVHHDDSRQ